jgi:gamma-tubulin complex component 5
LRSSNYARINQFDVQQRLDGLEEKFRIYDEDDLADALRRRLDELVSRATKWAPEILYLLLELSDKPVQNAKLEYLDFPKPPDDKLGPPLKWEDLAAEDPLLRDKHVWSNIDYTADSSGDEGGPLFSDLDRSGATDTFSISSDDEETFRRLGDLRVTVDQWSLEMVQKAQYWKQIEKISVTENEGGPGTNNLQITERQAIRDILYMLSGLPTTLFVTDSAKVITGANLTVSLSHASPQIFHEVLSEFAQYGNAIGRLRAWTTYKQTVPLLQRLQAEVLLCLNQFNSQLSELQAIYVTPKDDTVVSLIELQVKLASLVDPLQKLCNLIKRLDAEPYAHAFRYLELLYHEACTSQMAGNDRLYEFMGRLFFNCFEVYLRPIRRWMEDGELSKYNNVFFISEIAGDFELSSLWQNRFRLRKSPSDVLHAPNFLQTRANKIFTTGKSVVVLKYLGKYDAAKRAHFSQEPKLDFETVCNPRTRALVPFSQLLDSAFEQWVQSKHHAASSTLRMALFNECGLRPALDAMEKIYFMADGANVSVFANAMFEKLDSGKSTWNDRFTLTELAQSTIGSLEGITAEGLRAISKYSSVQKSRESVRCLSSIALTYGLPWSVQIIITKESITCYQRVFSFLLQIRRSRYMLENIQVLRVTANVNSSADERALFYSLRSKLLWFTSILYTYLTNLVIHTSTLQMRAALAGAEDIDCMVEIHQRYIKRVTDQAFLGSRLEPIHETIIAILDLSIELSDARKAHTYSRSVGKTSGALILEPRSSQRPSHKRRVRRIKEVESENDDSNGEADRSALTVGEGKLPYIDHLKRMRGEFDHLCKFVCTGIRGVTRAGGEPSWDMFADLLSP